MEFSFDKGQRPPNTLNNKTKTESDPFAEARSQHQAASRPQSSSPQFSNGPSSSEGSESSAEDRLRKAIERNRQKQQMRDGGGQAAPQATAQTNSQANMGNDELARKRAEQEAQIRAQFEAQQRARQEAQLRAQYEEQQMAKEQARAQEAEKAQMQARQLAEAEARLRQAQAEQRARQESRSANPAPVQEQGALFGERPTMMNRQAPPVQPEVISRPTANNTTNSANTANKEMPRESLAARLNALNKANAEAAQKPSQASAQNSVEVDPLEKKITSKAVVTRQRVARVEDEFTTPVKKAPRKVTTPAYINKKAGGLDPKWQNILVKGSWIFCGLMLVRLFFSQGGILDFYDQSKILTDKKLELEQIRSENMALTREISRMQNDTGYQKKIVRDNLGFIAQDEFLILFPKEI